MDAAYSRVQQTLADLFSLPRESVTGETAPDSVEAWDSMGHLMFVEALEQEFDTHFSPDEVERMTTVAAVVRVIESRHMAPIHIAG